jgi:hypothetical protein
VIFPNHLCRSFCAAWIPKQSPTPLPASLLEGAERKTANPTRRLPSCFFSQNQNSQKRRKNPGAHPPHTVTVIHNRSTVGSVR